jgi:membrane associated rhomboid family serine protease
MNVDPRFTPAAGRQRVFNLPPVLVATMAVLFAVHILREYVLGENAATEFLLALAFIPIRVIDAAVVLPGGTGARIWTFVSYALLHADWTHLIFNMLWLAAFGSAVAWRFGPARFLGFSAVGAAAGAALHLAIHPDGIVPLVGASAAISAHMAGAARFAFTGPGPFVGLQGAGPAAYRRPAPPLSMVIRDRRVVTFLGVWFITNLLFGLFGSAGGLTSGAIAWEAHIGGFVAGLLFFPIFDPVPRRPG